MPLLLRLLLVVVAGASIMGARLLTHQHLGWPPALVAVSGK